jgi:hypothetical protein
MPLALIGLAELILNSRRRIGPGSAQLVTHHQTISNLFNLQSLQRVSRVHNWTNRPASLSPE